MYDINDTEDFISKLNIVVDVVNQFDADEISRLIEELDNRLRQEERDSCLNMGIKAMLMFSMMYREPEKAKSIYAGIVSAAGYPS